MTKEHFAGLMGEVMAGSQVPMSLGALGTARRPLIELREALGLGFGYHTTEDAREAIRTG